MATFTFRCLRTTSRILNALLSDWSLRSVFDRSIQRACPVARSSKIRVELPSGSSPYSITPDPSAINDGVATYVVDASELPVTLSAGSGSELTKWTGEEALDVAMRWPMEDTFEYRAY